MSQSKLQKDDSMKASPSRKVKGTTKRKAESESKDETKKSKSRSQEDGASSLPIQEDTFMSFLFRQGKEIAEKQKGKRSILYVLTSTHRMDSKSAAFTRWAHVVQEEEEKKKKIGDAGFNAGFVVSLSWDLEASGGEDSIEKIRLFPRYFRESDDTVLFSVFFFTTTAESFLKPKASKIWNLGTAQIVKKTQATFDKDHSWPAKDWFQVAKSVALIPFHRISQVSKVK